MAGGAFRDASAAIERAQMLEAENEELKKDLADLAEMRVQVEELAKLREEVAVLRSTARGENESAYVTRLGEERDQLHDEIRELRQRLAEQQGELTRLRFKAKAPGSELEPLLERIAKMFRK